MRLTVFGATGGVGRHIVAQALADGHTVRAMVRDPSRLEVAHSRLTVVQGDVLDAADAAAAVQGSDAVLVALGMPLFNRDGVRARGTANIVRAMRDHRVRRLVCLSVFGAGESWAMLPRLYRWVIGPVLLRHVIADHAEQEKIVAASGLDWVLARPGNFTDGERTRRYWHGAERPARRLKMNISRADVADFMLGRLAADAPVRRAECLSY
jgi:uncharacterized protein YbjT (DUF2867 family)